MADVPRQRGQSDQVHDIVHPTPHERQQADLARRRRRYFFVMIPCLVLFVVGFAAPLPVWVRGVMFGVAAFMPPVAAIIGNRSPF